MTIGGPDPFFGNGGVAPSPVGAEGTFEEVVEVAGGKLVALGTLGEGQVLVARYNANGTLDTTFDGDGWATYAAPGFFVAAAIVLPDGKVMVLGSDARLLRLTTGLAPDPTFGENGFVRTTFPPDTGAVTVEAEDLALQPDGKILAGITWRRRFSLQVNDQMLVARYNGDGSLDTTFSGDGFAFVDFAPGSSTDALESLSAVAVLTDGRIALGGTTILDAANRAWAYGILSADGTPVVTQRVTGPVGNALNSVGDIQPLPGGGFLVAGTAAYFFPRTNESDMVIARYLADGTPDTTFGTSGHALAGFVPVNAMGEWLAVQGDGKAIVGGRFSDTAPRNEHYATARFLTNGTLDPTWGQGGRAAFAATPRSAPTDMILTSNGGLVFSGVGASGPTLVRLQTAGRVSYRPPTRPAFRPDPRQLLGEAPNILG